MMIEAVGVAEKEIFLADMENNKDMYDEKREKKRKVHREWQRNNKDKVKIYHERYAKKMKLKKLSESKTAK